MGIINVYKGISKESNTYNGIGKLKTILKKEKVSLNYKKCVILLSGKKIDENYIVKEHDIIFIRQTPFEVVTAVISLVVAITSAVIGGVSAYKAKKLQEEAEEQQRREQAKADAFSKSINALPFLRGAKNRSSLGLNIPFFMGNTYNVPYTLTSSFYTIGGTNGEKQYWNCIFITGFKTLIQNVNIGTTTIVNANSQKNGVPYITEGLHDFNQGTYFDTENKVELQNSGEMQSLTTLNYKVTSTDYAEEIPHKYGETDPLKKCLIKQLANNTYKVDVCISFDALRQYGPYIYAYYQIEEVEYPLYKTGWHSKNIIFDIYYSNNTTEQNPTWHKLGSIETGELNTDTTVRFSQTYTFDSQECYNKDIAIKIVRVTPCNEKDSQETAMLCFVNCWQYDATVSSSSEIVPCKALDTFWENKTTRIGLKVISNANTKDNLDEINTTVYAQAKTWNGNEWSEEKYPTRNPASCILEILTSDVHVHSKYSEDEIDLQSLGELYEYCEEEEFYTDGAIVDDTKKDDVIAQILSECNSTMYINSEGLLSFAIEKQQSNPVALLNDQSIKSITVSKTFERKPFAQKITYTNRDSWKVDTTYIDKDGDVQSSLIYDKQKVITEIACKYITTFKHAFKYAHRSMAKQTLQPREVVVQVGHEGDYYPLYSTVLLQTKRLAVGLSSGVIKNVYTQDGAIIGLDVSDICDFSDETKQYGMIIQSQTENSKEQLYCEVTGNGKTRSVRLTIPLECDPLPIAQNIYSFGYLSENGQFTTVTNKMMITALSPNNEGWELTLKDYSDDIFNYGTIPPYKTNLTNVKETGSKVQPLTLQDINKVVDIVNYQVGKVSDGGDEAPLNFDEVLATAEEKGINITCKSTENGLINKPISAIFELSKDNGETWSQLQETALNSFYSFDFEEEDESYLEKEDLYNWKLRYKAVNIYGASSEDFSNPINIDVSSYKGWLPSISAYNIGYGRTCDIILENDNNSYGKTKYKVSIKKLSETADEQYFCPNLTSNPYENELNYKDEESENDYTETYSSHFVQTLPLNNQDSNPNPTLYKYRIVATNESEKESEEIEINFTALSTSAKDIANGLITGNKIAEETITADKLHADVLTANKLATVGMVAEKAIIGNLTGSAHGKTNYWNLENGEFRLGDENQYLVVKQNSNDYEIKLKAGNISLTSCGLDFNQGTYFYDENDSRMRLHIIANGIEIEKDISENNDWSIVDKLGKVFVDNKGNFTISNGFDTAPVGAILSDNVFCYNFNLPNLEHSENGGNVKNITVDAELTQDESFMINNKVVDGEINVTMNTLDECFVFGKNEWFIIGEQNIIPNKVELTDSNAVCYITLFDEE